MKFLDVLLSNRGDDGDRLAVLRKALWNGQYIHFHGFIPLGAKGTLNRFHVVRARGTCAKDTLEAEHQTARRAIMENAQRWKEASIHVSAMQR